MRESSLRLSVGFIGLGVMGRPMATNLLAAGYEVGVHSRSEAPVAQLVSEGARKFETPAQLGSAVDTVVMMLPDTGDVEAVVAGEGGLLEGMAEGSLLIDMSTISPVTTRVLAAQCAARSIGYIDAPVSGGERGAIEATLSIMAGGSDTDFARAQPILQILGGSITHIGPVGAGQVAKAANQLVVGSTILAVAEALRLASDAGVDPSRVRSALLGGFAGSRVLEVHGQRMLEGVFEPGFRSELHLKDARIILDTAATYNTALSQFPAVVESLRALVTTGRGWLDHSAMYLAVESEQIADSGADNAAPVGEEEN